MFPYLLRNKSIAANQVWALDTSYIPMSKGFVYLTAVIDWATRKVLAHKIAITLEASHAVEVLNEAFAKFNKQKSSILTRAVNSPPGNLLIQYLVTVVN